MAAIVFARPRAGNRPDEPPGAIASKWQPMGLFGAGEDTAKGTCLPPYW